MRLALGALLPALMLPLMAQETPQPNRVAWMSIFPEPLPEGVTQFGLDVTNQFLRPDREDSIDGLTHAQLQGEDWEVVSDLAKREGPGIFNVRTRLTYRSSGLLDRAIMNWHGILGVDQGGRDQLPCFNDIYLLQRNGVTVFSLERPRLEFQGVDVAYVVPWGDQSSGGRAGATVQLPTGREEELQSSGGTNFLAGGAIWKTFHLVRLWAQAEEIWISLPQASPLRQVVDRGQFWRAWAGLHYQGPGGSFWKGFGLDLGYAYNETPYFTKLVRIDKYGLQQTWTVSHLHLPRWRFGFTEKGGTFSTPEITFFTTFRP